ncbi:MAG: 3-methyl-2-oxobutanoate hydroxymethyltransferase [Opitutales bacterium]|nr:3-methyl-2-oxobutanoate hydroxymethyltransferase [Opitutales bacterium]MBQ2721540.1 3-methyl-2-oxobutanoate hydroxymethyltransferase [Opitutales bacterium]MBR7105382.1 3-methyl-2-oxobutanoate hydroxymethyltransferase [Opitutales bacterium]
MKKTTKTILKKKGVEKIAMITAYDAMFAKLADSADVDIILVGDSVGNTVLGYDSTIPVTIDMMVHHTSAVARAKPNALILADLPFACAHYSFDKLLDTCKRLVQEGGADAIKIEGGVEIADKIAKLTRAGIAVMGHIGLEPQQVLKLGGYRKFGKSEDEKKRIIDDAKALEQAGVFTVLMEMTDADCASEITKLLNVPTIGIGSGSGCDGQVLVCADILGLTENPPSFVKQYAKIGKEIVDAYSQYVTEVRNGQFPAK